ncbi:hypothetical protein EDB81DRAFT_708968 [Dactylonectria macrodidyma]|uniref:Pre-mRNA-processing protein prp40 n=1 Tax=Dactylonectria macrodidyma TaxID=307937 RepID=A0A9P9FQ03_9HYPO|nr:hypothetical protein EDB81DRAFT_708968 [Dactylonectria macrodidyma]
MNGFGAPAPYGQPASSWQEHHTPDGRAYYYNPATKATQWTKPEDMMTAAERALANQPWKEYTAEGGRKYWYNTETKQSSWEMPDAYKSALGATSEPATPAPTTPYTPGPSGGHGGYGGGYGNSSHDHRDQRDQRDQRDIYPESRQLTYGSDPKAQAFVPASNDPEYATAEEAEVAFTKLLKRSGVQPDWTWEQTIRATVRDPQFRAIKDPKDRRAAFEKYGQDMLIQDKERAKERLTKLRADFETMLKRHPEITHYTRWKTARPMIEGETIFRSTNSESERRHLFEEYILGLQKVHAEQQITLRKNAMDGLIDLLPKLDLEPYTRWSDAQGIISSTPFFQSDESYQTLTKFDILTAFQNHMKALERKFNDTRQEEKNQKFRKERKARDAFKALLSELRRDGKINAGTKWKQIIALIESDERYINMAGNGGSTPQELFWDVVEEEERSLRGPRNEVLDVLQDKRFELTPTSDFEEFLSIMKDDRRTANIDRNILNLIFDRLREKRSSKRESDDRQSERQQRRAVDDLRAYMKRMEPPITLSDTYEKVRPRLLKSDEFQAITSEDARRSAFDKHLRRLREKEEEADRSYRRRDRMSSERDLHRRERDRSRGERSHRSGGRGSRRSRSPEPDAYEADRRKAIAERERNHRKSTMAEGLLASDRGRLSPPPRRERERERERDRERDFDRPSRPRREDDSHYDRERRDREDERERLYRRRIDRGSYDELPYGDERPSGSRRRRPDDEDDYSRRDSRDSKRLRRDKSRERTPQRETPRAKTPPPATKDVHSGSEEGEIEED